jgi:hypothetical protein
MAKTKPKHRKDPAAVSLGRWGGLAFIATQTPEQLADAGLSRGGRSGELNGTETEMPCFKKRVGKHGNITWLVQVFCDFGPDGKRIIATETSKSPRKADARTLARQLQERLAQGTLVANQRLLMEALFDDLLNDYKINGKDYPWAKRVVERHLKPRFGRVPPEKVTTSAIREYVAGRLEGGTANGTINRSLALLKRAFNLAREATPPRLAQTPYIPMLAEAAPRSGFFEHTEYLAMRDALPAEVKPILGFAYWTGCRRGEILSLQWRQVDLIERAVGLPPGTTKNREGRVIPLRA